jgi:hypothetical protein
MTNCIIYCNFLKDFNKKEDELVLKIEALNKQLPAFTNDDFTNYFKSQDSLKEVCSAYKSTVKSMAQKKTILVDNFLFYQ